MTANTFTDTILLVDDDPYVLESLSELFADDYGVLAAASGEDALAAVGNGQAVAAVVMDIRMADMDGLETARRMREIVADLPIIFHTGYPGDYDEDDIDSRERPYDYVQKGEAVSRLTRSVRNAVEASRFRRDQGSLVRHAETAFGIIGRSEVMQSVYKLIRQVSPVDAKVMILGETGTGKELVARALHFNSRRKEGRLAILNCNHKAPDLVESELFGHVKGAFTGAHSERVGLFEYAHGGTVFLDEIGDLDITTQAKLLRVLENGEFQPIGAPDIRTTDVRILCATHKDLEAMVEADQFRRDLFYRLKGITVRVPPLRERREDIPVLVERFKDRFTVEQGLPPTVFEKGALDMLYRYDWPGNVRQLLDTIESLIVLNDSDIITAEDVRSYLNLKSSPDPAVSHNLSQQVRQYEHDLIRQALDDHDHNVSAAARALGVDRANLRKKIKALGIDLSLSKV